MIIPSDDHTFKMKQLFKGIEFLPLIVIVIILYKLLNNFEIVTSAYEFIINMLVPFIWAFAFAYLLNPLMVLIQKKTSLKRFPSIIITYAIVTFISGVAIRFVFPEVSESAIEIVKNFPDYMDWIQGLVSQAEGISPELFKDSGLLDSMSKGIEGFTKFSAEVIGGVLFGALNFANQILKIAIGIIISIYFLLDKEKFILGTKKIVYGLMEKSKADHLVELGTDVNLMFSKFIVGKTIDSLIIGIIAFFGMLLINAPYPVLFAFIIGVTNMIPFFGPFFGGVPVTIITLFYSPLTGLWCGLFILLLQQFDGYILGPKILGDSVGMSAFWIILSILVGGALFGVIGMLIAVPATAVIRNRVIKHLDLRLAEKGITLEE